MYKQFTVSTPVFVARALLAFNISLDFIPDPSLSLVGEANPALPGSETQATRGIAKPGRGLAISVFFRAPASLQGRMWLRLRFLAPL